ncbi:Scarecrow-like protein 28 [Acorus gramineus]|uniref:Scarecrow-like protein 28 n=1 Tax=Acorus gramineus TaxID=55184 RepID=A0AAV9AF70_ACOGR|nr:Scarecrow-like protein 28 [Acorus gramineus]
MSTQRLDLPCNNFPRRPIGVSIENPIEPSKPSSLSLRQNTRPPAPLITTTSAAHEYGFWKKAEEEEEEEQQRRSLKRFCEYNSSDESCISRVKRKRPTSTAADDIWVGSVVTHLADAEDKVVGSSRVEGVAANSATSSSSAADTGDSENERPGNNGSSRNPCPSTAPGGDDGVPHLEQQGLELVSLFVACVDSIGSGNHAAVNYYLARLGELAAPTGASPIHRVVAYFTEALSLRVARLWPHVFRIAPPRDLDKSSTATATALRLLNHVNPIPRFLHFTLNERLLRAFEGKDRIHIIDFDIKQGLQWPGLFQSLASRPNPPSHVRITGIGESKHELHDTGARLAGLAGAMNLAFEFHPVVDRIEDVRLWMLHVKEGECVAVNCVLQLHKVLDGGEGGALRDLYGLIKSANPTIVLVAEQEAKHNEQRWEGRILSSLKYYSAIFDSVHSSLPMTENPARIIIEEMFAREIRDIVACGERERVERHEEFEKWRRLMGGGGFRNIGIGEREEVQSRMLLRMFSGENYSIERRGGDEGLTLNWMDQSLYTVSAWAPVDVAAGGSSSPPSSFTDAQL